MTEAGRRPGPSWAATLVEAERLPAGYLDAVVDIVAPLAFRIEAMHREYSRPVLVGISGAQGSGKTTLARFLENWLREECDLTAVTVALDDFYLTRQERQQLAEHVHPLFVTRGVPGTHDVELLVRALRFLLNPGRRQSVELPAFDKASDDRLERPLWRRVVAPVDVVLFEGWCVGAVPEGEVALEAPLNRLEATEDPNGQWRRAVNDRLRRDYAGLFARLDALVMLRIAAFEQVREWRGLQERKLRARRAEEGWSAAEARGQSAAELERFILHYERLTRHMLDTLPRQADAVIDVDEHHRMRTLRIRVDGALGDG